MKAKLAGAFALLNFFLLLFTAGTLCISSAQAAAVYVTQYEGVPGVVNNGDPFSSPQSSTYSYQGGTLDVNAAAAATALPAASASVTSGGCTSNGCAGGVYSASAEIIYQIEATGAAGVMVPYYFDTAGGITFSGGLTNGAAAQVDLIAPGGTGLTGFSALSYLLGNGTASCGTVCVNGTQYVSLLSNTTYTIIVSAEATVFTNYAATLSAWADPYIYIDPNFAGGDQFSLVISDGVGNAPLATTPLPSGLPMVLTGVGLVFGFANRKKLRGKFTPMMTA